MQIGETYHYPVPERSSRPYIHHDHHDRSSIASSIASKCSLNDSHLLVGRMTTTRNDKELFVRSTAALVVVIVVVVVVVVVVVIVEVVVAWYARVAIRKGRNL